MSYGSLTIIYKYQLLNLAKYEKKNCFALFANIKIRVIFWWWFKLIVLPDLKKTDLGWAVWLIQLVTEQKKGVHLPATTKAKLVRQALMQKGTGFNCNLEESQTLSQSSSVHKTKTNVLYSCSWKPFPFSPPLSPPPPLWLMSVCS